MLSEAQIEAAITLIIENKAFMLELLPDINKLLKCPTRSNQPSDTQFSQWLFTFVETPLYETYETFSRELNTIFYTARDDYLIEKAKLQHLLARTLKQSLKDSSYLHTYTVANPINKTAWINYLQTVVGAAIGLHLLAPENQTLIENLNGQYLAWHREQQLQKTTQYSKQSAQLAYAESYNTIDSAEQLDNIEYMRHRKKHIEQLSKPDLQFYVSSLEPYYQPIRNQYTENLITYHQDLENKLFEQFQTSLIHGEIYSEEDEQPTVTRASEATSHFFKSYNAQTCLVDYYADPILSNSDYQVFCYAKSLLEQHNQQYHIQFCTSFEQILAYIDQLPPNTIMGNNLIASQLKKILIKNPLDLTQDLPAYLIDKLSELNASDASDNTSEESESTPCTRVKRMRI